MIPVIGVPVLVRPETLEEMLGSIDVEVGRVVIVDNGGVVPPNDNPKMTIIRPGHNLGVSASWNLIMKATPDAAWWAFVGFDIVLAPGDLARLAARMDDGLGVGLLGGFSAFGFSRHALKTAGWFDENYIPAYFEDNDMDYRCRLTGVTMEALPAGMRHRPSSTIRSSLELAEANSRTFAMNARYFLDKWGGGAYREVFTTPFDKGGSPRDWELDIDRLKEMRWGR